MASADAQGWNVDQVVALLDKVPLFNGLPRDDLETIAGLVRGRSARENELLFREGDPGDKFYIVYEGAVEILKERPRGEHDRLAIRRTGEPFGEMSLLTDAPRSASARATQATQLLMVSKEDFDELLGGESLSVRLMRQLAKSLQALDVRFAAKEAGGASGADTLRQFSRVVQRGLLPRHAPEVAGYEVAGGIAQEEGGFARSLWDATRMASGETCLAVLDVKGGGVPPAYVLGVARALLREVARTEKDVGAALSRLNAGISVNMFEGLDEVVEAALFSLGEGGARLCVAGEQPGIVVRADGETQTIKSQGLALGIVPTFTYKIKEIPLAAGDTLVVFSEAEAGLLRGAADLILARRKESAEALAEHLQTAIYRSSTRDDMTFIIAKRR